MKIATIGVDLAKEVSQIPEYCTSIKNKSEFVRNSFFI